MNDIWTIILLNICITSVIIFMVIILHERIKKLKNDFRRCNIYQSTQYREQISMLQDRFTARLPLKTYYQIFDKNNKYLKEMSRIIHESENLRNERYKIEDEQ